MMAINMYHFDKEHFEDSCDVVKAVVVQALVREGLLGSEKADAWAASHTVIVRKKSFFRTVTDKFLKAESRENWDYYLVVEKK